jgi:GT2 family glycosyltransferase
VLSVIIATYNKRDYLDWTLRGLARQRCDVPFEVIVAVDGSTDGTLELLDHANGWNSAWSVLKVVDLGANMGRSAARNEALKQVCGNYVVSLDDDSIPSKSLIANHEHIARSANEPVATIGRFRYLITSVLEENVGDDRSIDHFRQAPAGIAAKCSANLRQLGYADVPREFYFDQTYDNGLNELSWAYGSIERWLALISRGVVKHPWVSFATAHVGFSSSLIDSLGGFDERFTGWGEEDAELGYRMFRAGCKYKVAEVPVYNRSHVRDVQHEWSHWHENYEYFVEKYGRPYELTLRWRLIFRQLSGQVYESMLRRASSRDVKSAERSYERFLIEAQRRPESVANWFLPEAVPDELAFRG